MAKLQRRSPCKCGRSDLRSQAFVKRRANLKCYDTRSGGKLINGIHGADAKKGILREVSFDKSDFKVDTAFAQSVETSCMKVRSPIKQNNNGLTWREDNRRELKFSKIATHAKTRAKIVPSFESAKSLLCSTFGEVMPQNVSVHVENGVNARANVASRSIPAMNAYEPLSNDAGFVFSNGGAVFLRNGLDKHEQETLPVEVSCFNHTCVTRESSYERNASVSVSCQLSEISNISSAKNGLFDLKCNVSGEDTSMVCQYPISEMDKSRFKRRSECQLLLDSLQDLCVESPSKRQCKPSVLHLLSPAADHSSSKGLDVTSVERNHASKNGCFPKSDLKKKSKTVMKHLNPVEHFLDVYLGSLEDLGQPLQDQHLNSVSADENISKLESVSPVSPIFNGAEDNSVSIHQKFQSKVRLNSFTVSAMENSVKKTTLETLTHDCFDCDDHVERLLGLRDNKGTSEVLVLFKDGTSNWISMNTVAYDNNMESVIYGHYTQIEQELSCTNRLFFKLFGEQAFKSAHSKLKNLEHLKVPDPPRRRKIPSVWTSSSSTCPLPPYPCDLRSNHPENVDSKPVMLSSICSALSADHLHIYSSEKYQEVVTRRDKGFTYIFLQRQQPVRKVNTRKSEDLSAASLSKVTSVLEDCLLDHLCRAVIMSGIEDFFASSAIIPHLLKTPAFSEGRNYEEDISAFRLFVQTVRCFTKPIVALISKPAVGLAPSVLALFDLVVDEGRDKCPSTQPSLSVSLQTAKKSSAVGRIRANSKSSTEVQRALRRGRFLGSKNKKTAKRSRPPPPSGPAKVDPNDSVSDLHFVAFPRLMGLANTNEAALMGTGNQECCQKVRSLLAPTVPHMRTFSAGLRVSLKRMKKIGKLGGARKTYIPHANALGVADSMVNGVVSSTNTSSGLISSSSYSAAGEVGLRCRSEPRERYLDSLRAQIELEKELATKHLLEIENLWKSTTPT